MFLYADLSSSRLLMDLQSVATLWGTIFEDIVVFLNLKNRKMRVRATSAMRMGTKKGLLYILR